MKKIERYAGEENFRSLQILQGTKFVPEKFGVFS
jgi:hypothetical protein